VVKYTAILACGNYHGVVGYAKAKGPAIPIALQKVSFFFGAIRSIMNSSGSYLFISCFITLYCFTFS
jgi:hypothetical protein